MLVNISLHAEQFAAGLEETPVTVKARRGRILDRRGNVLAESDEEGNRHYPSGLCAHAVGTLSASGDAQSGVELAMDELLAGKDGISGGDDEHSAIAGADVYLTIDSRIQQAAENILRTAAENYAQGVDYDTKAPYSGSAGAVVVLDCRNGEVLAMASYPTFDPETFSRDYESLAAAKDSPLLDRASLGLYRPGSTMKTVTAVAALTEGSISGDTRFYCGSHLTVAGTGFSCMNSHGYLDVKQALSVSCNIFFYRTAQRLGIKGLLRYQSLFGFGEQPAFILPTLSGQLASPENTTPWSDAQLVQAAIGQSSMTCTPLQMAICALTLADRGTRYSPSLILGVGTRSSVSHVLPGKPVSAFRSRAAFSMTIEGMISSTRFTHGEFSLSQLDKPCAIKTGTPQSPRGYDSTVIGFYPADDPQIAFCVMLEGGANAKHTVYELVSAAVSE